MGVVDVRQVRIDIAGDVLRLLGKALVDDHFESLGRVGRGGATSGEHKGYKGECSEAGIVGCVCKDTVTATLRCDKAEVNGPAWT